MKIHILLIFIILFSCKTNHVKIKKNEIFIENISSILDFESNENIKIVKHKKKFDKLVNDYLQNNYFFVVSYFRESYFSFGYLEEKELLLKKELINKGIDTSKVKIYPFFNVNKYLDLPKLKKGRIFLVNNFVLEKLKKEEGSKKW